MFILQCYLASSPTASLFAAYLSSTHSYMRLHHYIMTGTVFQKGVPCNNCDALCITLLTSIIINCMLFFVYACSEHVCTRLLFLFPCLSVFALIEPCYKTLAHLYTSMHLSPTLQDCRNFSMLFPICNFQQCNVC